jgi:hypothetical protein
MTRPWVPAVTRFVFGPGCFEKKPENYPVTSPKKGDFPEDPASIEKKQKEAKIV